MAAKWLHAWGLANALPRLGHGRAGWSWDRSGWAACHRPNARWISRIVLKTLPVFSVL